MPVTAYVPRNWTLTQGWKSTLTNCSLKWIASLRSYYNRSAFRVTTTIIIRAINCRNNFNKFCSSLLAGVCRSLNRERKREKEGEKKGETTKVPRIFPVPIFSNRPDARNSDDHNESPQPFLVFSPPQLTSHGDTIWRLGQEQLFPPLPTTSPSSSLSLSARPAPVQKIETISSGRRKRRRKRERNRTPGNVFPGLRLEKRVIEELNGEFHSYAKRGESWMAGELESRRVIRAEIPDWDDKVGFRWRKLRILSERSGETRSNRGFEQFFSNWEKTRSRLKFRLGFNYPRILERTSGYTGEVSIDSLGNSRLIFERTSKTTKVARRSRCMACATNRHQMPHWRRDPRGKLPR